MKRYKNVHINTEKKETPEINPENPETVVTEAINNMTSENTVIGTPEGIAEDDIIISDEN